MATCKFKVSNKTHPFCIHYIEPKNKTGCGFCAQPTEFRCREKLKTILPSMSYSSRTDFISCRMKYYYRKIMGVSVRDHKLSDPLKAGRIWDEFIELKYNKASGVKDKIADLFNHYQASDILKAKLTALIRAFLSLNIKVDTDGLKSCQHPFDFTINNMIVRGYIDRAYNDYIVETKLSGRPDFYKKYNNICNQVATYFYSNKDYESCIMEVTRLPQHKYGKSKKGEETIHGYQERIFQDIISRPTFYFQNFKRKDRTFGLKFWRSEFDMDEIKRVNHILSGEIRNCIDNDLWYPNKMACHNPGNCFYLPICENNVISESIFQQTVKE